MAPGTFYILPDDNFDDWIVREMEAKRSANFATKEEAQLVEEDMARKRPAEIVIHLPDGLTQRKAMSKGWIARSWDRRWQPLS